MWRSRVKTINKQIPDYVKIIVLLLMDADNFSIDMFSINGFSQIVILILFLDFQFMRIVFLAMVKAMESILLDVLFRFMLEMSPTEQSEGDDGMWQPKKKERLSLISRQNCLIGVQSHVACI